MSNMESERYKAPAEERFSNDEDECEVQVEFELLEGQESNTADTALVGGVGALKLAICAGRQRKTPPSLSHRQGLSDPLREVYARNNSPINFCAQCSLSLRQGTYTTFFDKTGSS